MNPRGIFSMPTATTVSYSPVDSAWRAASIAAPPDEHAFSRLTMGIPVAPSTVASRWPAPVPAYMCAQNSASTSPQAAPASRQRLAHGVDAHVDRRAALEAAEGVHPHASDDDLAHRWSP